MAGYKKIRKDGPTVNTGFALFQEEFLYRMKGEIDIGDSVRLQDYLNKLKEGDRIPVSGVLWEINTGGRYEYTEETKRVMQIGGTRKGSLLISTIDLVYPKKHFYDRAQAKYSQELTESVGMKFHLRGIKDHVKGQVLILRGSSDESPDAKEERLANYLDSRRFVAVVEPKNRELSDKLETEKIQPILVNTSKIRYFELYYY